MSYVNQKIKKFQLGSIIGASICASIWIFGVSAIALYEKDFRLARNIKYNNEENDNRIRKGNLVNNIFWNYF